MESLTKLALSNMEYDTQMVSILYRTHKSLPTSGKVPSLYVFDSLARAARSQATKMRADPKSPQGNAAAFLAKIEGVLDGLIRDMIATGIPEAKQDLWQRLQLTQALLHQMNLMTTVMAARITRATLGMTGPGVDMMTTHLPDGIVAITTGTIGTTTEEVGAIMRIGETDMMTGNLITTEVVVTMHEITAKARRTDGTGRIEGTDVGEVVEGGEPAGAVDEFGREIRPGDSDTPSSQPTEDGVKPGGVEGAAAAKTGAEQAPSNGPEVAPAAPGATGPEQVESAPASDPKEGSTAGGLESLDFSSLNFSDPVAWTTLGKAWEVSYGRLPMQEEMMMFMAQGMNMDPMALMGATMTQNNANGSTSSWNAGDSSWNNAGGQTWNGHQGFQGRGRGRGRGRGGRGYGGYNAGAGGGQQAYPDSSDAVILGGDTTDTSASNAQQASYADGNYGDGSNYGEGYANGYGGGGNDGMYAAYGNGYYDGSGSGNGDAMGGAMYSAGATQDATAPTGEETQVDGEGSAPAEGRSKGGHMVRVGDGWQWVKAGDGSATS
ncbi:hypothetical protein FRB99_005554 [Tulasnella sp. 403]|nr:hypothetical protein FRB99_005554 [Tulasnella sp. 403]